MLRSGRFAKQSASVPPPLPKPSVAIRLRMVFYMSGTYIANQILINNRLTKRRECCIIGNVIKTASSRNGVLI